MTTQDRDLGMDRVVVSDSDVLFELDQEMIAESRRLAALGKYRPMREFLDERRSQGKQGSSDLR